jgi:hypothetical protein
MNVSELYEPLIERDLPRIEQAVRSFRREHSSEDLYLAVARFAILAYAPSQHAKHATLAVLAAYELRDDFGERWDELLLECAKYAAQSRQPWSEPPLLDPPVVGTDQRRDVDELRAAVAERDRLRAERWLSARLDDDDLASDLFTVASDDFEDLGHKLIVANGAWRLAPILGEKGRFATLRVAVWEMVSYSGAASLEPREVDAAALLDGLIANAVTEKGSLESAHAVFLFDAALQTENTRAMTYLFRSAAAKPPLSDRDSKAVAGATALRNYPLAKDYAALLKANAVAKRLRPRFPRADLDAFVFAVAYNLDHAPSFEEWSFA